MPFALEEQLATEIEAMHFALGRQGADGRVAVAAVERERFAGLVAALEAAGLAPAAVYSTSLVVPDNPAHVVVVLEGQTAIVRRPGALPLALDADPLAAALEIAGLPTGATDGLDPAANVLVYADSVDWPRYEPVHRGAARPRRDAQGAGARRRDPAAVRRRRRGRAVRDS